MFDQSASKRLTEYLEKTKKVLTSAENGWALKYYPDPNKTYGGYNYALKFNDQTVDAYYELAADPTKAISSTYILNNEDGPVILFDTYNSYLHHFTTPSGSSGAGGYQAYRGDHMFIVMEISEDENEIILKGARSGNIMHMTKLSESPASFMKKIAEGTDDMIFSHFIHVNGNDTTVLDVNTSQHWIDIYNEKTGEEVEAPFIFTVDGIELAEPVEWDGITFSSLKYDPMAIAFTIEGEKSMTFKAIVPEVNEDLVGGIDWYIGSQNACAILQSAWATAAASLKSAEGETLEYMVLEGDMLYMNSSGYGLAFQLNVELIGNDQVKITVEGPGGSSTQQGNANYYIKVANFSNFYAYLNGTFKLEYANKKRNLIKLTSTTNPDLNFIVSKAEVAPY